MVGKGVEPKSSRIFHQCYLKCCKLQNLTPLNALIPGANGKVLDFCVDRIKYPDWPPILNALSCDLSLHSLSVRCRQPVKTVLEQIDCERLAKTVNKRAVILTNFMLNNLIEAIVQLLTNTTLLTSLLLEGLPLKIPYLTPLCEVANHLTAVLYDVAEDTEDTKGIILNIPTTRLTCSKKSLLTNSSLQHLYLPRCLIGDAGCLAVCKAVRCLPNILTLDLTGCELTPLGASYLADLIKYQKIHRYSENWVHTLRYRLPELDAMAGLRRITVCGNPQLGDTGVGKLLDVLSDDLWIKALDAQNCGLTEETSAAVMHMMQSNTTLVVLDLRHNDISGEWLSKVRTALRDNERGIGGQFSWLASSGASVKSVPTKNGVIKDRNTSSTRIVLSNKYANKTAKKDKDYAEILEEQLQEEISHRQQLEELNLQLVDQMKQLKQQQIRLWANAPASSGSEQSFQVSSRSEGQSSSSGSSSSVPIDQNTLSYIQQAFKDIYAFIKNNQCHGQCLHEDVSAKETEQPSVEFVKTTAETDTFESTNDLRINIIPKKAQSTHVKMTEVHKSKTTRSAHLLGDLQLTGLLDMKPDMIERQMGDSKNAHNDEPKTEGMITAQVKPKKNSIYEKPSPSSSSIVSDSSDTLVCSPDDTQRSINSVVTINPRDVAINPRDVTINPREALYSSEEEADDDSS